MGDQPSPRIEVGATIHDEVPCIYVRDNGLGIDPAYHEKIFGLFDKLDDSAAGTGIGLALVKRIVEVHGGRIWVESQGMGHGSTFCFTLGGEGSQQMQSATGGNYER
jgi:signal transduction histidine kinase